MSSGTVADARPEQGAAASGCGQETVQGSCGQAAAEDACGQGVAADRACGQGAVAAGENACGQAAAEDACRQGVAADEACGQGGADSSCGQGPSSGLKLLDAQEMGAWRAFLAASIGVTAALNRELEAGAGISMHEYEILVRLSEAPGRTLRMSTLADNVSHSRSRLTHTVGRLEKEGYVLRSSCQGDRRGVNCELTPAGYDFLRTAAPIHLSGVRRHVIERLHRSELADFTTMLSALVDPDGGL